jgi:hypothetical protein
LDVLLLIRRAILADKNESPMLLRSGHITSTDSAFSGFLPSGKKWIFRFLL